MRSRVGDVARLIEDSRDSRRVYSRFSRTFILGQQGSKRDEGNQLPRSSTESHYSAEAASRSTRLGFARAALRNADDGPCRRVPLSGTGYPLRFSMSDILPGNSEIPARRKAETTLGRNDLARGTKKGKVLRVSAREADSSFTFPDEGVATSRARFRFLSASVSRSPDG